MIRRLVRATRIGGAFAVIMGIVLAIGCAMPNHVPVEKTQQLAPGMSYEEIILTLGEPYDTSVSGDDWELSYPIYNGILYRPQSVWYKLVLDKNTRRLKSWGEDKARMQQDQVQAERWLEMMGMGGQSGSSGATRPAKPAESAQSVGGTAGGAGYLPATRFCLIAAPYVGSGSYSRVNWLQFDTRGRFQSGGETYSGGDAGQAYGLGGRAGGSYTLKGEKLVLRFDNGDESYLNVAVVQQDGMITELVGATKETIYAISNCKIIYGD